MLLGDFWEGLWKPLRCPWGAPGVALELHSFITVNTDNHYIDGYDY
jgi:hypothetical protein